MSDDEKEAPMGDYKRRNTHGIIGKWILAPALVLGAILGIAERASAQRTLTFDDRLAAQEAIERVYYSHRIWPKENPTPKPPFEEMVSRAQLEAKVEDYLKKSVALDTYWERPLTGDQLQAEMDRMVKNTKDPDMLRELFAALGNDPFLIAECLARPVLSDRLIRNWYAYDERFHGELKQKAVALRWRLTPENFRVLGGKNYHAIQLESRDSSADSGSHQEVAAILLLAQADFAAASGEFPDEGLISGVQETDEAFVIRLAVAKTQTSDNVTMDE